MRFGTKFLILGLVASMTFLSCKKMFDLKPEDGIIRDKFWETKEQVHAAVVGVYASLMGDLDGNNAKNLDITLFTWGELRADMLAPGLGAKPEDFEIMNMNTQISNTIVDWSPVYKIINYCNTVIQYAPDVRERDNTFTKEMLDETISEMKAIRALMYFYLVRSFGDVPLKINATSNDDEIVQLDKSPQAVVLQQIVKDLNEAEAVAVETFGDEIVDKGRVTKYTINAIQADVALWMEDYDAALVACDKVIGSNKYALVPRSTAWYTELYRMGNSVEGIFEIQFDQQKLNDFFTMFGVSSKRYIAANKVMDMIYTTEYNDSLGTMDIRGDGAAVRASDGAIWKYIGNNADDLIGQSDSYTHWIFYRYADILLMKAEALAQMPGRGEEAMELVKEIRDRAAAPLSTEVNPDFNNVDEMSRYILDERAREFAFEGKRWYDVLRYAKKNNYEHISYLQDLVGSMVPANTVRLVKEKLLDHNSHYFPIYTRELETNKKLTQNPFYQNQ